MSKLKDFYSRFVTVLFFIYLAGVLSFGRAFATLHLKIGSLPVFVTELLLIIIIPMLFLKMGKILELPKSFLIALSVYFSLGILYLTFGILNRNFYCLRDIVLCGYILFLPFTFIVFSENNNLRIFFNVYIFSNIICILAGRICMFICFFPVWLKVFGANSRFFNFGLYYGMAVSIYICLLLILKNKAERLLLFLLLAANIYMIFFTGERSLWISLIILMAFFLVKLGFVFLRLIGRLLPYLFVVLGFFYYFDFMVLPDSIHITEVRAKAESVKIILQKSAPVLKKEAIVYNSCTHRDTQIEKGIESSPASQAVSTIAQETSFGRNPAKSLNEIRVSTEGRVRGVIDNLFWRIRLWEQSINFGLESPIFGRGFGIYPDYRIWYYEYQAESSARLIKGIGADSNVVPSHNELITIFYKMGLLGLGLFLFINIYVFVFALGALGAHPVNKSQFLLLGFLGMFIFWHVLAFFFNVIDSPSTTIFLWIISGIIFSMCADSIKEQRKAKVKR